MEVFEQSDSLRRQFCTVQPKLLAELKLTDDDIELPTVILELLSDPSLEPTVQLGRRLLDSGSIDDLIAMAPQRRADRRSAFGLRRDPQSPRQRQQVS